MASLWTQILWIALLTGIPCPKHLHSQNERIQFEHLTIDQGLPQNRVVSIYQDDDGFMWFGTLDGLTRYDGYTFTHYKNSPLNASTPLHNFITVIYEDRYGTLWVGTDSGLLQLNRQTAEFRWVGPGSVVFIGEDLAGELWVGTVSSGIYTYDRDAQRLVDFGHDPEEMNRLRYDTITAMHIDKDGVLWIGTGAGELLRYDPAEGRPRRFEGVDSVRDGAERNHVTAICEVPLGQGWALWLGVERGLFRLELDGRGREVLRRIEPGTSKHPALSAATVRAILYDQETEALWIGTNRGLFWLSKSDMEEGRFIQYRHDPADPASLNGDDVWAIHQDRSGTVWIGTSGGVNKMGVRRTRFRHLRQDPDDPTSLGDNRVWSIYEDRAGTLWVGTQKGLSRLLQDGEQQTVWLNYNNDVSGVNGSGGHPIRAILEDRSGTLWLGTLGGGLGRFDPTSGKTTYYHHDPNDPQSIRSDNIYALWEDRSGDLWIGANDGGLSRLRRDGEKVAFTNYYDRLVPSWPTVGWVLTICESRDGFLWIGTWEQGLVRFDRETEQGVSYVHDAADPNTLSNNTVLAIHEDGDGGLWIGTYGGGLCQMTQGPGEKASFQCFSEKDGLPNNVVYGIVEDDSGTLWLSTNRGLSRFDPRLGVFQNFGVRDGLQSNEFNLGANCKRRSGEILFGGHNGLNRFYPEDAINRNPPIVQITAFKRFGERVILDKPIAEMSEIHLSPKEKFFSFEFVALHYENPAKNQYAYMLEGFDDDWNYIGTRREAGYTNLDPGDYLFRVKAANSDGLWNEQGASIKIVITPPLWRKRWFLLIVTLGVSAVVLLWHRYRVQEALKIERARSEEKERLRVRMSADLHDELALLMTHTRVACELLERELTRPSAQVRLNLDKIRQNAEGLFKKMRMLIWEVDPQRESAYELAVQLKAISDEVFEQTEIGFELSALSSALEEVKLRVDWRRHLVRMFKEAMHNILKHAKGCKHVTLAIVLRGAWLEITLRDDGGGFDATAPAAGDGLGNMLQRARELGGELTIISSSGEGTEVRFVGELPEGVVEHGGRFSYRRLRSLLMRDQ